MEHDGGLCEKKNVCVCVCVFVYIYIYIYIYIYTHMYDRVIFYTEETERKCKLNIMEKIRFI